MMIDGVGSTRIPSASETFVEQLCALDVDFVFGNPGTTEYSVLDALCEHQGIELVLCLHEAVAVSAAAGYARASGAVGVVQLHAGPGLGNGLGMLYDARVGQTPLVVFVGQCEQSALYLEPLLSGDFVSMARPVSKWCYEIRSAEEVPQVLRRAVKAASTPPRGPVVLSGPIDLMEAPCIAGVEALKPFRTSVRPDSDALRDAAAVLSAAESPAFVVGDGVAAADAVNEVSRIARLLGAPIFGGMSSEVCVAPTEALWAGRLRYEGSAADRAMEGHDVILAVGTSLLPQIFPLHGSPLPGRQVVHVGLDPWELGKNQTSTIVFGDERAALRELVAVLAAQADAAQLAAWETRRRHWEAAIAERAEKALAEDRADWDAAPMSPARAVSELAGALPEDVCMVDESLTSYGVVDRYMRRRFGPRRWFRGRGGGIGEGMAMAVGVQLARPGTPVVALVADGSAMYSLSALWTAAHHSVPVTWVILNNRSYRMLKENAVLRRPEDRRSLPVIGTDLVDPEIDFVALARGLGVEGRLVREPDQVRPTLRDCMASGKPQLIELVVGGLDER